MVYPNNVDIGLFSSHFPSNEIHRRFYWCSDPEVIYHWPYYNCSKSSNHLRSHHFPRTPLTAHIIYRSTSFFITLFYRLYVQLLNRSTKMSHLSSTQFYQDHRLVQTQRELGSCKFLSNSRNKQNYSGIFNFFYSINGCFF